MNMMNPYIITLGSEPEITLPIPVLLPAWGGANVAAANMNMNIIKKIVRNPTTNEIGYRDSSTRCFLTIERKVALF
jgi:hypothetical protein